MALTKQEHIELVAKYPENIYRQKTPPEGYWSGDNFPAPPPLETRIIINFNGFGPGAVKGYFREHGYVGVYVEVDKRPDWHVSQLKGEKDKMRGWKVIWPMVFGAEITPEVVEEQKEQKERKKVKRDTGNYQGALAELRQLFQGNVCPECHGDKVGIIGKCGRCQGTGKNPIISLRRDEYECWMERWKELPENMLQTTTGAL